MTASRRVSAPAARLLKPRLATKGAFSEDICNPAAVVTGPNNTAGAIWFPPVVDVKMKQNQRSRARRRWLGRMASVARPAAACMTARYSSRFSWMDAITGPVGMPSPTNAASDN